MRKPLPKSEKKVRVWTWLEPELKETAVQKAEGGNLSALIRELVIEYISLKK